MKRVVFQPHHTRHQSVPSAMSPERLASRRGAQDVGRRGGRPAALRALSRGLRSPGRGPAPRGPRLAGGRGEPRCGARWPRGVTLSSIQLRPVAPSDPRRETRKSTRQTEQAGHTFVLLFPMHQIIVLIIVTNFILFTATLAGSQKGEAAPGAPVQEPAAPGESREQNPQKVLRSMKRSRAGGGTDPGDPEPHTEPGGPRPRERTQPHSGGKGRQGPAPWARRRSEERPGSPRPLGGSTGGHRAFLRMRKTFWGFT